MEFIIVAIIFIVAVIGTGVYFACRAINSHYTMLEINMESRCKHEEIQHIGTELQILTNDLMVKVTEPFEKMMDIFNPEK